QGADVLIIDNDGSSSLGLTDYTGYYTTTLESLGYTYEVWDADAYFGKLVTFPDATSLARYPTVIYQTGDNATPSSSWVIQKSPSQADLDRLTEYVHNGGHLIVFGQDLWIRAKTFTYFYRGVLGAQFF